MGDPSLELWKSEASQHKLREEGQLQVLQASEWSQDVLMCPEKYLKSVDICCKRPTCSLSSLKNEYWLITAVFICFLKWVIKSGSSPGEILRMTNCMTLSSMVATPESRGVPDQHVVVDLLMSLPPILMCQRKKKWLKMRWPPQKRFLSKATRFYSTEGRFWLVSWLIKVKVVVFLGIFSLPHGCITGGTLEDGRTKLQKHPGGEPDPLAEGTWELSSWLWGVPNSMGISGEIWAWHHSNKVVE